MSYELFVYAQTNSEKETLNLNKDLTNTMPDLMLMYVVDQHK